jgi:hypothetical protein
LSPTAEARDSATRPSASRQSSGCRPIAKSCAPRGQPCRVPQSERMVAGSSLQVTRGVMARGICSGASRGRSRTAGASARRGDRGGGRRGGARRVACGGGRRVRLGAGVAVGGRKPLGTYLAPRTFFRWRPPISGSRRRRCPSCSCLRRRRRLAGHPCASSGASTRRLHAGGLSRSAPSSERRGRRVLLSAALVHRCRRRPHRSQRYYTILAASPARPPQLQAAPPRTPRLLPAGTSATRRPSAMTC